MSEVFVIRNQLGHYWGKGKAWVDGRDPRGVQRSKHRDEATNLLFELSAREIELRGEVIAAELSSRGEPVLTVSEVPPAPEPEQKEAGAGSLEASSQTQPAATDA